MLAARQVAGEQRLDELRDELAELRMQAVDVFGALALRQVALGPRELEVDLRVELILRRGHAPGFGARVLSPGPPRLRNARRTGQASSNGSGPKEGPEREASRCRTGYGLSFSMSRFASDTPKNGHDPPTA